jgi:diguanylate cyclase
MDDDQDTLVRLRQLADLGVRLAIDDFGTGYSNLAYVKALPVHTMKLAGQFVDDLRQPPTGQAAEFLRILVDLAHLLGLTVTAEGVETKQQADTLRDIGCEAGQGYFLGYPTAPGDITRLLADNAS